MLRIINIISIFVLQIFIHITLGYLIILIMINSYKAYKGKLIY